MTALGEGFAEYVQPLVGPDYTDLYPLRLQADPAVAIWGETETVTLTAEVANYGRQPAEMVEVRLWEGDPDAGGTLVIPPQVIQQVPGRYEGTGVISATWTPPAGGSHTFWVEVDPAGVVAESNEENNRLSQTVLVATTRLYLPVVLRASVEADEPGAGLIGSNIVERLVQQGTRARPGRGRSVRSRRT
jgi:hypothetical protein